VERLRYGLLIVVAISGCSQGVSYVPVTGTVKFSDGSVPQGDAPAITFQPASSGPTTKGASGTIAKDGTFSLQTVQPGDGALPGEYVVTVRVMQGYPRGRLVVAEKFTKPETTPLNATVEAGGENHFDFTVEKP
jgi:hypothetical protein